MTKYLFIQQCYAQQCFDANPVSCAKNFSTSLNMCVGNKPRFVYKAQILTSGSSQGNKLLKTKTKTIRSRYPSNITNVLASRSKQDCISMDSHFKSVLHVFYLICRLLYNRGIIYVVGYKTQILISLSFSEKSGVLTANKKSVLGEKLQMRDHGAFAGSRLGGVVGKGRATKESSLQLLNIEQENWCASSLSNWQNNSEQLWRTACFLTYLQDFAMKNSIDLCQFRGNTQKKLSLLNQLVTIKTDGAQESFMPFIRQPDLLILFNAESKRSVLKQAKSLQIPTIVIANSNMDTSQALYSLPGNHKSIHLLYRILDNFSLLSKKKY